MDLLRLELQALKKCPVVTRLHDSYCFWATDLKYALMKAIQELAAKVAKLEAA